MLQQFDMKVPGKNLLCSVVCFDVTTGISEGNTYQMSDCFCSGLAVVLKFEINHR